MPEYTIHVNGQTKKVNAVPEMPLLWVLRDLLGLTGAKYGCGVGGCGSCSVLVDGEEVRSCLYPISEVGTAKVTTIEGLSADGSHPVQVAWCDLDVAQCGYCQSGKIMAAAALLRTKKDPTDQDIDDAMGSHLCRCGTYPRIREAVKTAARRMK
jgi:isoquinoline 1-oxidoreductase alpha subunit